MDRPDALRLAIRCARDSMPPLRLAIIDDLAKHPESTVADVRRRINKPWSTAADRQLQALHMLGVLDVEEEPYGESGKSRWFYSLSSDICPDVIEPETIMGRWPQQEGESSPEKSLTLSCLSEESANEGRKRRAWGRVTDKSGELSGTGAPTTPTFFPPPKDDRTDLRPTTEAEDFRSLLMSAMKSRKGAS